MLLTVSPRLRAISGQAREAHFDAIYGDPALVWLISRQAREANFEPIYSDPAFVANLRTTLVVHFDAICGYSLFSLIPGQAWEARFDVFTVILLLWSLGSTC